MLNLQGLSGLQTLDQGRTRLSPEVCAVTIFFVLPLPSKFLVLGFCVY